jgi:hypothetical protein
LLIVFELHDKITARTVQSSEVFMLSQLVTPGMIVSRKARSIYRLSAGLSIPFIFVSGWLLSAPNLSKAGTQFAEPLLFIGLLALVLTTAGMEAFLFRFDDSSAPKQMFWFLIMLVPGIGAILYCFLVYSHSKALEGVVKRAQGMSA